MPCDARAAQRNAGTHAAQAGTDASTASFLHFHKYLSSRRGLRLCAGGAYTTRCRHSDPRRAAAGGASLSGTLTGQRGRGGAGPRQRRRQRQREWGWVPGAWWLVAGLCGLVASDSLRFLSSASAQVAAAEEPQTRGATRAPACSSALCAAALSPLLPQRAKRYAAVGANTSW
ncbi:hypothetical protein ABZP36_022032 [Zizania latifolia]